MFLHTISQKGLILIKIIYNCSLKPKHTMKQKLLPLISAVAFIFFIYQAFTFLKNEMGSKEARIPSKTTTHKTTASIDKSRKASRNKTAELDEIDFALEFPITCFAPGTDPSLVEDYYNHQIAKANSLGLTESDVLNKFNIQNRWTFTASDGAGLAQGDFTTLTWSYVDDGTPIGNGCGVPGESTDDSDVIAFLNGMYGAPTTPGDYSTAPWHQIFVNMFNFWSAVSGLVFVYEPNDDGANLAAPGSLGVRGDIRISGHTIDGNSGVLACNALPNSGDMIIDTSDAFFTNNPGAPDDPFLGIVNVLTHELGHGLGILHVCPINQTKLMEPIATLAFEAQQEDDILAVNRSYGDRIGNNDSPANAALLGDSSISASSYSESQLSIDDNDDVDYFLFTVDQNSTVNVILTPTGSTYLDGPQLFTGCSPGEDFNASAVSDLMVELIDQDGTAVIATGDSGGPGSAEGLAASISNTGTYFVRVQQQGNPVNNVQMYDLAVNVGDCTSAVVPVNLQASSITGTSAIIGWDAQDFALFDLRYRESGTMPWTTINAIVPPNNPLTNLTEFTPYEVQVRSKCPGGTPTAYSSSLFFTTVGITYCNSQGNSVDDEYISNVQFGTIDNTSADENGGYSDFTSISTPVIAGQDYPITITPFWTSTLYDEGYGVWIDFNRNGNFDDPGELVFDQTPTQNTPISGLISIPSDAILGETVMRVSMKFDGIPSPCENFDFGEVEDYTVEILDESIGVTDNRFGANVVLYPNPIRDGQFSVKMPKLNGEVILEIYTLSGKNLYAKEHKVTGQQVDVQVQNLPSGTYLLRLSQGDQAFSTKLIVK